MLADIFFNFQVMFLKIHELHLSRFLTTPRLAWIANNLKKIELELKASEVEPVCET